MKKTLNTIQNPVTNKEHSISFDIVLYKVNNLYLRRKDIMTFLPFIGSVFEKYYDFFTFLSFIPRHGGSFCLKSVVQLRNIGAT